MVKFNVKLRFSSGLKLKWLRADKVGQGQGQGRDHGALNGQDHGPPNMTNGQTEGLEIGRYENSIIFCCHGSSYHVGPRNLVYKPESFKLKRYLLPIY